MDGVKFSSHSSFFVWYEDVQAPGGPLVALFSKTVLLPDTVFIQTSDCIVQNENGGVQSFQTMSSLRTYIEAIVSYVGVGLKCLLVTEEAGHSHRVKMRPM